MDPAVPQDRALLPPFLSPPVLAGASASPSTATELPLFEVLAALGDGVWDWDLVADRVQYSERFMALLGYKQASVFLSSFSFRSHLHAQDLARVTRLVGRVLDGSDPAFDATYRLRHVSGSYRWFRSRAVVLRDAQGQALRLAGHLMDVHDRTVADAQRTSQTQQHQAQSAQLALTQVARGLAPGLGKVTGNLLRGLRGLAHELPAPWSDHAIVGDLLRLAERGTHLAEQLSVVGGVRPQRLEVVDLGVRVPALLSSLQSTAPAGVHWGVQVPSVPVRVLVDVAQLRLVLQALCTNAWQAVAEREAHIQVAVVPEPDGTGVQLSVSDDGVGMSSDVQARAFEPFFTARTPGQREGAGMGLGLAVVQAVVQGLQGRVSLRSEPGQGTTVNVWLPRVSDAAAVPGAASPDATDPLGKGLQALNRTPESAADAPAPTGRHVVYVDDYEAMVYLMTRMLTRRGQRVTAFERVTDALAYLEAHKDEVDLLVTDYNMPVLSGLDVVRRARALRPDLPVVITSGHVTPFMHSEAEAEGVLRVLNRQDSVEEQVDTLVALLATLPPRTSP
ncbi:PAS domain-containing hybrid sensor histidine kinase/response regulator [Hydrogenophaga soli]